MQNVRNLLLHGLYLSLYGLFKYLPLPFCNYLRFFILHLFSKKIYSTYVSDGVTVWFPWRVAIGKGSSLNQGVLIDGFGGISIGTGVRIAAYCSLNTADHDFSDPDIPIAQQGYVCAPIIIEDDVWIGVGTNINKGVTIGKGSVIGCGSVVTKNIPPFSIAAGVPCKIIRKRNKAEQ